MVNGIILLDKPKNISSNTAVNIVKHAVNAKKAGHLGTLDVLGHGLLPITLSKATKLFDYFLNKDKEYIASFKFGIETETFDLEGEIVKKDNKIITKEDVLKVIPSFIGKQNQMPPKYSAKKINGKKAYDIARRGEEVNLKPKEIEIYDLKLLKELNSNEFLFQIHCSSGTYIRSLCRDMAIALSTCGVMSDIIRTRCGRLSLNDAFSLEDIKNGKYKILPCEDLFEFDSIYLTKEESFKILNGVNINIKTGDGKYKVFDYSTFIGVGEVKNGVLKIILRLV